MRRKRLEIFVAAMQAGYVRMARIGGLIELLEVGII